MGSKSLAEEMFSAAGLLIFAAYCAYSVLDLTLLPNPAVYIVLFLGTSVFLIGVAWRRGQAATAESSGSARPVNSVLMLAYLVALGALILLDLKGSSSLLFFILQAFAISMARFYAKDGALGYGFTQVSLFATAVYVTALALQTPSALSGATLLFFYSIWTIFQLEVHHAW